MSACPTAGCALEADQVNATFWECLRGHRAVADVEGGDRLSPYVTANKRPSRGVAVAERSNGHAVTAGSAGAIAQAPGPQRRAVLLLMSQVQRRRVTWLWPGRIPLGKVTILDGDPDLGKSVLTLDLGARVSVAGEMPDGTRSELDGAAGVVILSAEDSPEDTIGPRLDAAGADPSRVVLLRGVEETRLELDGERLIERTRERFVTLADLSQLEEAIDLVQARLVIVDPVMAYLPSDTKANSDQDVRQVLAHLARLAEERNVAIVVIRHLNKSGGSNPKYRGGGSIGIIGAARSGLLVAEDPDDPARRILAGVKNNLAPRQPSLAYHLEGTAEGSVRISWEGATEHTAAGLLAIPGDGDERSAVDEAMEFLRGALADGERPAKEVSLEAMRVGIERRTLRRARERLAVLKRRVGFGADGEWRWSLGQIPIVDHVTPIGAFVDPGSETDTNAATTAQPRCRACGGRLVGSLVAGGLCGGCLVAPPRSAVAVAEQDDAPY